MSTKGVKTFYPGKVTKPITINLTEESTAKVAEVKAAIGASHSDLQEHGMRKLMGLPVNPDLEKALAEMAAVTMQAST